MSTVNLVHQEMRFSDAMKSRQSYPPIKGNPRRNREASSDAGVKLSNAHPASQRQPSKRPKKPDQRLKVTLKDRELIEELSDHFGISMSAVLNLGLIALAEKHGFR